MRGAPRGGRDFAPAVADHPADESARTRIVSGVAPQGAKKEADVLAKRIELVPERLPRTEQVAANLAGDLEDERRLRFLVRVIGRQEIREQFVIFVNRIDRVTEEP